MFMSTGVYPMVPPQPLPQRSILKNPLPPNEREHIMSQRVTPEFINMNQSPTRNRSNSYYRSVGINEGANVSFPSMDHS